MAEEKDKKDLESLIASLTSDLKQRATFTNKLEKLLETQSDSFSQLLGLVLRVYGDEGNIQSVQTKLSNLARSEQTTLKQELRELGSLLGVIPSIIKPYLKQEELEKVFPKEEAEEISKRVKNFYDQLFDPEILKVVLTRSRGDVRESANIAVKTFVDFISGIKEDFLSLERASRITLIKSLSKQKSIQPYFLMQQEFLKEGEFREFLPIQDQIKTYSTAYSAFREQYEDIQRVYRNLSLFGPFNIFNYGEISRSLRNEALKNIFNTLSNQRIILSEEINRINQELSSKEPKTEEEIAKLKEQRTLLTKEFFETLNKEIAIRKELNKELENALNQIKSFSIKSADLLFSTTRNPFVDIFTSAIRTGLQVGSSVGSATQNILSRVLLPTQVNIPNQRRPPQQRPPTTPTTQQPPIIPTPAPQQQRPPTTTTTQQPSTTPIPQQQRPTTTTTQQPPATTTTQQRLPTVTTTQQWPPATTTTQRPSTTSIPQQQRLPTIPTTQQWPPATTTTQRPSTTPIPQQQRLPTIPTTQQWPPITTTTQRPSTTPIPQQQRPTTTTTQQPPATTTTQQRLPTVTTTQQWPPATTTTQRPSTTPIPQQQRLPTVTTTQQWPPITTTTQRPSTTSIPQQQPITTTTQLQRNLQNQIIFSTRNLFRGGLLGLGTSLLTDQLFGDGIQRQDIPRILGGTIGGILGSLVPVPYLNIGTSILGFYLGANLGSFLGEKFEDRTKQERILAENLKNLNLSSLNLNEAFLGLSAGSFVLSNSFANLNRSLPNIFTPDLLSRGAGLVTGIGAGLLAGFTDFFLSSLNKSYDIFYQNFVQSRLIPQGIRERLGNLSDITGAFVAGGRFPILGQGFTREELLGTAGRLNALIPLQNDLNRFRENVFRAAESANLFGTSIAEATSLVATSTKALTSIDFAKQLAFSLTEDYSAFSKAFAEAILQTSTSLAIRQFANPSAFAFSFGLFQNMFRMSPNQNLAQLALYNPEVIQNTFNTFNEFIRSGLTNPVAGGILLRAGLTPREMLMGATPENLQRIIPSLMAQVGLYSQYVGGEFTAQARQYLLPFVQQTLGFTNISPDIFEDVLRGFASGRSLEASERLSRILAQPSPIGRPPDRQFAEQLDTLNASFQVLTEIMQQNIGAIRDLNQAILGLTITILDLGAKSASDIVDLIGKSSVGLMGNIGNERYREILNQIRQRENVVRNTANIVRQRNEQTSNNISVGTQNQMPEIRVSGSSGNYVIFVEGRSTVIDTKELGEIIKKMKR